MRCDRLTENQTWCHESRWLELHEEEKKMKEAAQKKIEEDVSLLSC
jgi:hypothetical protein